MLHIHPRRVLHRKRAQPRALKRRAQARLRDPVRVRDHAVMRLGEEHAVVRLGLDVCDDEGASRAKEGGEDARDGVDVGEVVVGCAALAGA